MVMHQARLSFTIMGAGWKAVLQISKHVRRRSQVCYEYICSVHAYNADVYADFVTVTRGTKTLKSTVFATKNLAQHTQKLRVTSTEVIRK